MAKVTNVNCANCNKEFEKRESHVKYFRKQCPTWNFYCSPECLKEFKTKKKEKTPRKLDCEFCHQEFEITVKGSGGQNRKYCYDCYPEGMTKKERQDFRYKLLYKKSEEEKINMGCKICGYNKITLALEWHHPDANKDDSPSNLLKRSWKAYKEETEKCVLLCSNCHREVHAGVTEL